MSRGLIIVLAILFIMVYGAAMYYGYSRKWKRK